MSTSLRSRIRQACLLGCASGAALLSIAIGGAAAATTTSVVLDSTFEGEAEGWSAAANEGSGLLGLCIEGLTCPQVSDEFHATGGAEDTGYIETKEGGLLAIGLAAENSGSWESPEFTYMGVAGQRATKVELTLARRAQLANLLALSGAQSTYTVELADQTDAAGSVVVVNHLPLSGAEEWKTATTPIAPTALEKGDAYKVVVRTTFVTPAAVVPAGGVGYDNVELTASRDEVEEGPTGPEGPAGPGGSDGTDGADGSNGTDGAGATRGSKGNGVDGSGGSSASGGTKGETGSGSPSVAQLREAVGTEGLAATAKMRGRRVIITGMCPKAISATCTVRIKGLLNRHKAATSSGRAKIAIGARHRFSVAISPRAVPVVRRQGRLLVKEWVRVGTTRAVVYKKVRVIGG